MSHRFVTQPYDDGYHLLDFFKMVLADEQLLTLDVVVAWVKRSGLRVLRPSIEEFRSRGGIFQAISGISQGGTSKQGLTILDELTDQAFVFHDPSRTFHPKIYVATGDTRALVMVGSHNFTFGGATANYEAAVLSELDLTEPMDEMYLATIAAYIERLTQDSDLCIPLDRALIEDLDQNPRYRLSDEDATGDESEPSEEPAQAPGGTGPEASPDGQAPVLFGRSKHGMRSAPPSAKAKPSFGPVGSAKKTATAPVKPATPTAPATTPTLSQATGADAVVKRWFKTIQASDAQQLSTSRPSNTMTLVKNRHPIDGAAYFRSEFFGDEMWSAAETLGKGQPREITSIVCDVFVRGNHLGPQPLSVRHTPGYAHGRGNRTTELAWGEFGEYLRTHPLTGMVVSLEKTVGGHYRLTFDETPTGAFLP